MDLLRGLTTPAWAVGVARGLLEAIVLAVLAYLVTWLGGGDLPEWLIPWAPAMILILRSLEGLADQIDPAK